MKRLTIFFAFLAALLLAACEQEVERPTYSGEGINATWMSSIQPVEVSADDNTVTVVLQRGVTSSAVEVPLTYGGEVKALIDAPKSISFGAGESETSMQLKVNLSQLNPAITNKITIKMAKEMVAVSGKDSITLNINVVLTYTSIGKGTIQWDTWHEDPDKGISAEAFEVDIEKADGFNIFRVPDPLLTADGKSGKEKYRFSVSQNGVVSGDAAFTSEWKYDDTYGNGVLGTSGGKLLADGVELYVGLTLTKHSSGDPFGLGVTPMVVKWPASFTLEGVVPVAADSVRIVKINQKIVDGEIKADTVHHTRDTVFASKSITLKALIYPDNATSTDPAWTSLDPTIATVDEKGTVTGEAAGTARIVAYDPLDKSIRDICEVTVKPILVEGLKLDSKKLTINAGKGAHLVATVSPDNATNKEVLWTIEGSDKLTFFEEKTGTILLMVAADAANGKAKVIAQSKEKPALSDTCVVTIKGGGAPVTPTTYAIGVAAGIENGTVSVNPTEAAEGAEVTITVSPADGYQLKDGSLKVNNGTVTVTGSGNTYTFEMPAAEVTVTAEFEAIPATTYAISIGTFSNGSVTSNPANEAEAGATVTLTVAPADGYQLKDGSLKVNNGTVTVTGSGNTYTFEMPAAEVTVTAEFEAIP